MLDGGGGGGYSGPTDFESLPHESLLSMIQDAKHHPMTDAGRQLLDAKETLETITTALETRIDRLDWTGQASEDFREWSRQVMLATRRIAEQAGQVGDAMNNAGSALSLAAATMPPVPANAKVIADSNGDQSLMCVPGEPTDKSAKVELAKVELEKARQEAIRTMEGLSSSYTINTSTLEKLPPVTFPPLPALPARAPGGAGGGLSTGPAGSKQFVKSVNTVKGVTMIPGHGPTDDRAVPVVVPGQTGIGWENGVRPVDPVQQQPSGTGLLGDGRFATDVPTLPPDRTGPLGGGGPVNPPPGGGQQPGPPVPGPSYGPGLGRTNMPGGGKTGGTPPPRVPGPVGRANLQTGPGGGTRNVMGPGGGDPVSGGRPFTRGPMGGGGGGHQGQTPSGGGGVSGARRLAGHGGGIVGGSPGPRVGGPASTFSSGGSGLGGRSAVPPPPPAGNTGGAAGRGMARGPMGAGGPQSGEAERRRRQRADYLHEDEETWTGGTGPTAPPVVGG